MNRKTKNLLTKMLVLSAVLAFAVVACDFKPSTAFDGFDGETSSGIIDEEGATLRGTFLGGQGRNVRAARAQRASTAASDADALTVYVFDDTVGFELDDALGSAPIVNGSFTVRGLPDSFVIVFVIVDADGNMVGAPYGSMPFEGVKPNQELDIAVELDGNEVILLEESRTGIDHDELEFNGSAYDVRPGSNPMNGTLVVNEYYVVSRAGQTSIRKGNLSLTLYDIKLVEGVQIKVRGVRSGEIVNDKQEVFAQEIKLQDDEEDDVAVDGKVTICHIPPGNPGNAKTITISESALAAHLAHGDYLGACGRK